MDVRLGQILRYGRNIVGDARVQQNKLPRIAAVILSVIVQHHAAALNVYQFIIKYGAPADPMALGNDAVLGDTDVRIQGVRVDIVHERPPVVGSVNSPVQQEMLNAAPINAIVIIPCAW